MAKFPSISNTEQQLNIASSSARGVGHPNSSSVSSAEQAVLKTEENIDLAATVDAALSAGLAMAERSLTRSPTNREGTQIQQLHGDDGEGAGRGSVYFVDSVLPSTTSVDSDKAIGEKATNAVDKSDDGAEVADCCSHPTESLTASTTVETERLATDAVGGWRRPRGRGRRRARRIPLSASVSRVCDTAVGSQSIGRTSRVGRGRMGRRRARQSYIGVEKDSSIERAVGCVERGNGTETSVTGGTTVFKPYEHLDPERSVGVAGAGGERRETPGIISGDQERGEFSEGHLQLTSTPTRSQAISNESHFLAESLARPPTRQLRNLSLPAVVDAPSLQVSNQWINSRLTAVETKLSKLSEMVTELNQRLDQISKQKVSKSSFLQSDEMFTDERLMRIKAAAFMTGRPLSAHACKQLVLNMHDNEPPCTFNSDDIRSINDHRECRDAPSLSKWAVFEMFSLQELVGRNCLGGGHDTSAAGNAEIKKPFDECKMQIIKNAVFSLYPQQKEAMRKAVWMKCVYKINTDVRYLFKVSLKKHEWLQLGF